MVCWDGDRGCLGERMNLCGDRAGGDGEGEGAGVGFPPRQTSGGGRKSRGGTKKYSNVTISYGA